MSSYEKIDPTVGGALPLATPTLVGGVLAFNAAITSYAPWTMTSGGLALTAMASPLNGAEAKLPVIPDGTHVPTVPAGWQLAAGSQSYSQTNVNLYDVWYEGQVNGGTFFYGILTGPAVPPTWSSDSAPGATVGTAYSYTYAAAPAPTYAVFSGTLPAGLSLNTSTGVLSGTPTTAQVATFVISATNSGGTIYSPSQVVTVAPIWTADSPPAGTVGTAYTYTYVASNATAYALASGALPGGLTLNAGTGVLSGTPTTAATFTFTVTATTPGGNITTPTQSIVISPAASGSLTGTAVSNVSTDMTASAYLDYGIVNGAISATWRDTKTGAGLISALSMTNAADNNSYATDPAVLSCTDGNPDGAFGNSGIGRSCTASSGAGGGFQFTVPAGLTPRKCRVWAGAINWSGGTHANIVAHLSDGSAADVTVSIDSAVASGFGAVEFTYNAASNGQSLTVKTLTDASNGAQVALFGAAYY